LPLREGGYEMKTMVKGKILSSEEFSRLVTVDDSEGITHSDIKKTFSSEDLKEYDKLCTCFFKLIGNKNNKEQWDMLLDPATGLELLNTLNGIEELRAKYNVLGTFHKMWRAKPLDGNRVEYDEVSWR
jgi:hypothetical protein